MRRPQDAAQQTFAEPLGRVMRIRSPKDFWAGLIFVAIGGGFVLLAQQYRLGDMHRMGPAMFPTLVGALLAALGLIMALRSFARDGAPISDFHARPIVVSLLAIVLFGIALQWLGLVAAVAVLVLIGANAARDVRQLDNLALAAGMILFSVAV
ncbi:MAG TPA: tripartite tricarboxylate transporter TctB family protein, partial [Xanthobacteraceae bacterium]|nr:tripartite tricarboxylate transporter TctB family protein [Xanthobacteraceae bacterium]